MFCNNVHTIGWIVRFPNCHECHFRKQVKYLEYLGLGQYRNFCDVLYMVIRI